MSPREIDLLELIGQGYTCQQAADVLNLSVHTVGAYVKKIKKWLQRVSALVPEELEKIGLLI